MKEAEQEPAPSKLAGSTVGAKIIAPLIAAFFLLIAAFAALSGIGLIIAIPIVLIAVLFLWAAFKGRHSKCPYCKSDVTFPKDTVLCGCPKCHKALRIDDDLLVPVGDCPNCGNPPGGTVVNAVMKCRSCKHRLAFKDGALTSVS